MDRKHFKKLGQDHLDQLDGYEDWQAEEALHSWAAEAAHLADLDDDPELAEKLRLDGRTTEKAAVRKAFKDRIAALS